MIPLVGLMIGSYIIFRCVEVLCRPTTSFASNPRPINDPSVGGAFDSADRWLHQTCPLPGLPFRTSVSVDEGDNTNMAATLCVGAQGPQKIIVPVSGSLAFSNFKVCGASEILLFREIPLVSGVILNRSGTEWESAEFRVTVGTGERIWVLDPPRMNVGLGKTDIRYAPITLADGMCAESAVKIEFVDGIAVRDHQIGREGTAGPPA